MGDIQDLELFEQLQFVPLNTTIGDYSTPVDAESVDKPGTDATHNNTGTDYILGASVTTIQFTGLLTTGKFNKVEFDFISGFATGNIRIKIYDDNAGSPDVLLFESGSIVIPGSGKQIFTLPSIASVPGDGKLWVGIEGSGSIRIESSNSGTGIAETISHTYGAGPDPFGAGSPQSFVPYVRILAIDSDIPAEAINDDTGTHFESNSVTTPELIIDHGSLVEFTSIAVYKHVNDTVDIAKIQVSPDKITWTDARKLDWVNDLADATWEFIIFNRPLELMRYVRVIGDDGGSKILAISEIKIRIVTESVYNTQHRHKTISVNDTTLPLNGDTLP